MSKRPSGGRSAPIGKPIPDETLKSYILLGRQFAAKIAEVNFRSIASEPGWTTAQVEYETECTIERLEIVSRDKVISRGADPSGENWQAIWTAMETGYRETMARLLRAAGSRGGGTLQ